MDKDGTSAVTGASSDGNEGVIPSTTLGLALGEAASASTSALPLSAAIRGTTCADVGIGGQVRMRTINHASAESTTPARQLPSP